MTQNKKLSDIPYFYEKSPTYRKENICAASNFSLVQYHVTFLHYHTDIELGVCISGSGYLYCGKKITAFTAGDMQIIFPGQPHYHIADAPDTHWYFINFDPLRLRTSHIQPDPAFLEDLSRNYNFPNLFSGAEYPELTQIFTSLVYLTRKTVLSIYDKDLLMMKLLEVLMKMKDLNPDSPNIAETISLPFEKIVPAVTAIAKGIENGSEISIAELAELCHFSQPYFRKIFTETMGRSPKQYLIEARLNKVAQLLISTDLPISEIQQKTGFFEASVFYRNFVKRYRLSPSAFRKQKNQ